MIVPWRGFFTSFPLEQASEREREEGHLVTFHLVGEPFSFFFLFPFSTVFLLFAYIFLSFTIHTIVFEVPFFTLTVHQGLPSLFSFHRLSNPSSQHIPLMLIDEPSNSPFFLVIIVGFTLALGKQKLLVAVWMLTHFLRYREQ
ncbi:hypothetical protein V8B55DRAFT_1031119 [Mucor lusitanicus]